MFLFFSVARSQENGSWERATETAHQASDGKTKNGSKHANGNAGFGVNMPLMSSAFDTAMWLNAA
jgi:hypothetical protein